MSNIDYKAIKKLADVCRKSGIKHYKDANFEFTLADDLPETKKEARKNWDLSGKADESINNDALSEAELLFWSTGNMSETTDETASE